METMLKNTFVEFVLFGEDNEGQDNLALDSVLLKTIAALSHYAFIQKVAN